MALKINKISAVLFTASLFVSSNLLAQWGSPRGNDTGGENPPSNMTGMPGPAQGAGPTNPVGYGRPPMPMYDSTNPVGYGRPPMPMYDSTNPVGYGRPPMPMYDSTNGSQYGGQNGARSSKGWPISQGGN